MINKRGAINVLMGVVAFSSITQSSYAEISYLEMKGLHSLFKSECSHLSPIHGFTAIQTRILPNIRFYGNYGEKRSPYGCQAQIREAQHHEDCPQDWTTALVQQLFPSPDGQNFVANQGSKDDPLSQLGPGEIGRLISLIHSTEGLGEKLELNDQWTYAVLKAVFPQEAHQEEIITIKKPSDAYKGMRNLRNQIKNEINQCKAQDASQEKLEALLSQVNQIEYKMQLTRQDDLLRTLKGKRSWKSIEPFANILFNAMQEERQKNSPYPKNIVKETLLAYLWKKAQSKEDFLKFAKSLPECISDENSAWALADPKELAHQEDLQKKRDFWISQTYQINEYQDWRKSLENEVPTLDQLKTLLEDPERTAFYAHSYHALENALPPIAEYNDAAHKSLGRTKTKQNYGTYPDCGETSLRNFFNIVLFDRKSQSFNPSILEKIQQKKGINLYRAQGKNTEKGLLAFYKRNSDSSYIEDSKVHDDWSRKVVSSLPGVNYLKGGRKCEMDAGMGNMQSTIAALIGDPKWGSLQDSKAKWNRICQIFSREGFELDWNVAGGGKRLSGDTGDIEFSINGKKTFTWHFDSGHFAI